MPRENHIIQRVVDVYDLMIDIVIFLYPGQQAEPHKYIPLLRFLCAIRSAGKAGSAVFYDYTDLPRNTQDFHGERMWVLLWEQHLSLRRWSQHFSSIPNLQLPLRGRDFCNAFTVDYTLFVPIHSDTLISFDGTRVSADITRLAAKEIFNKDTPYSELAYQRMKAILSAGIRHYWECVVITIPYCLFAASSFGLYYASANAATVNWTPNYPYLRPFRSRLSCQHDIRNGNYTFNYNDEQRADFYHACAWYHQNCFKYAIRHRSGLYTECDHDKRMGFFVLFVITQAVLFVSSGGVGLLINDRAQQYFRTNKPVCVIWCTGFLSLFIMNIVPPIAILNLLFNFFNVSFKCLAAGAKRIYHGSYNSVVFFKLPNNESPPERIERLKGKETQNILSPF